MQKCILYKLEIQCPSCELGTTAENSKFDLCAAMEQFGDWKLDEVIQNFSMQQFIPVLQSFKVSYGTLHTMKGSPKANVLQF